MVIDFDKPQSHSSRLVARKAVFTALISTIIFGFVYLQATGYWVFVQWYWRELFHSVKAPIETPINLTHQGVVLEKEFDITISCSYPLRITFAPDQKSWADMKNLIGGGSDREGVPLPIDITIEEKKEAVWRPAVHKMTDTHQVSHFVPQRYMTRDLGEAYLEKGQYKITVKSLRDAPELEGIQSTFEMGGMVSECEHSEN